MNKMQLAQVIADRHDTPLNAALASVEAVFDAMARSLAAGESVNVTGFGTLETVDRAARKARDPQTGATVEVPETTVPRFRPGQRLKDLVSGAATVPAEGSAIAKSPRGTKQAGR